MRNRDPVSIREKPSIVLCADVVPELLRDRVLVGIAGDLFNKPHQQEVRATGIDKLFALRTSTFDLNTGHVVVGVVCSIGHSDVVADRH